MDALLAIKPEFAWKILSGEKGYEFRRTAFDDPTAIDYLYLYASSPEQRVVGAFTTGRVVEGQPEELWGLFGEQGGIDEERFFEYFDGTDTGYAIRVDETHEFEEPIDPTRRLPNLSIPMSFCYLEDDESEVLRTHLPSRVESPRSAGLTQFSED